MGYLRHIRKFLLLAMPGNPRWQRPAVRACCLLAAALSLAGCAGPASLLTAKPAADLQWPQRPLEPKIVWIRSIASYQEAGIAKGFWKRAVEYLIGADDRHIVRPHGVLFDERERLFIADPGAGVVHMMDIKGGRYTIIGGASGSPLRTPIGLAEDERDHLYITDSTAGMVFIYDLKQGSLKPLTRLKLLRPTGIAYNRVNKLVYIVDTTANQVIATDEGGGERLRFGSSGEGRQEFNHPTDIAVDAKGELYVTDSLNFKIKLLTPEGQLVSQFGAVGDTPGSLCKPKGIAVDSAGHVYVADALLDTVQVFDDSGRLLMYFGTSGTADGAFWMPSGIFIDRNDYIFVADTYNQRVQVFRYLADTPPDAGEARTQGAR